MPAPEIGQKKAVEAAQKRQLEDRKLAENNSGVTDNQNPGTVSSEAGDGTIGLGELPDEDLDRLAKSQNVALPKDATRDQVVAALSAAGITRVRMG